jgi:methylase of polypeptide subunit release factors
MVRALGDDPDCKWLDPCVGDGAFIAAIGALGVAKQRILAFDLALGEAERDTLARTERGVDFVAWASRRPEICDRVVMNPPYVCSEQTARKAAVSGTCGADFRRR